jgi:hypothetical protein
MVREREEKYRRSLVATLPGWNAWSRKGKKSSSRTRSLSSGRDGVDRKKFELEGDELEDDGEVIAKLVNRFERIEWWVNEGDNCLEIFSKLECEFYILEEFQSVVYHVHDLPKLAVHVVFSIVGHVAVCESI